ncbi:MAG: glutathione S-transferase family protein [Candidatus Lindowbacteria bacterium]|nr:glutathione S-transferase family protein [Candidatus Lindowbacteria bacterium]
MSLLADGKWIDQWYDTKKTGGKFVRADSVFRNFVSPDPDALFPAESGRYHLYVSMACPWAHRTLIFRKLKGLEKIISLSVVHPFMGEEGWSFEEAEGVIPDSVNGAKYLHELYTRSDPTFTGRDTVPVLWDKNTSSIVNNESSEIIRIFNSGFSSFTEGTHDFCPNNALAQIDEINEKVYHNINNGVYRCGFATSQFAYNEAFHGLFQTLDEIEDLLTKQRFLIGDRVTEADWRLFTTLVRFDPVYHGHFKCNHKMIRQYPAISNYMRELSSVPGVAETVNMSHITDHYYGSHANINPSGVTPLGPEPDHIGPHNRVSIFGKETSAIEQIIKRS